MTTADEEYSREFARLSATFAAQLPRQVQVLSDDLDAWLLAPGDMARLDTLSHKVHQLKGAGGTFGCSGVSDAARAVEQYLAELRGDVSNASASAMDQIEAAMETLRGEANRISAESAQGGQRRLQT